MQNSHEDPNLWLEDVGGDRALAWVREQNAVTQAALEAANGFDSLRGRLLSIYESDERIPNISKHGKFYYNFWRDARHERGVWRRTTLDEYRKAEPAWETLIDLDQLAESEKENWVWKDADILWPTHDRALIFLSRGGADAAVMREFDVNAKQFVAHGFKLPEAKSRVAWRNRDSIYVGTEFGAGSLTSSGYPRIVKEWRRGAAIQEAKTIFEGKAAEFMNSCRVASHFSPVSCRFVAAMSGSRSTSRPMRASKLSWIRFCCGCARIGRWLGKRTVPDRCSPPISQRICAARGNLPSFSNRPSAEHCRARV
jgi:prolyl oligopeptidase